MLFRNRNHGSILKMHNITNLPLNRLRCVGNWLKKWFQSAERKIGQIRGEKNNRSSINQFPEFQVSTGSQFLFFYRKRGCGVTFFPLTFQKTIQHAMLLSIHDCKMVRLSKDCAEKLAKFQWLQYFTGWGISEILSIGLLYPYKNSRLHLHLFA